MRPMNFLALETATDPGSVALWRDGKVDGRSCPTGLSNSATLIPLVETILADAGLGYGDLDGIAFGAGPGSFTGLRVACGVALDKHHPADRFAIGWGIDGRDKESRTRRRLRRRSGWLEGRRIYGEGRRLGRRCKDRH